MPTLFKPALLGLALLLAACRGDPVHYHTLVPAQPPPATGAVDVRIEFLSVPPQVDRAQIVVRQSDSALVVLESEWWGSTLVDEVRSALSGQLGSNAQRVMGLRLEVQRFDSVPGQYALLEARWRLRAISPQGGEPALRCHSVLRTPAGAGLPELVAAQQRNIAQLASVIARTAAAGRGTCAAATP
ncbi:PqiC family protein [Pseudomonas aegrilactucae]|nr:PqiC family protein [Pseudomonas aegrilactucae]